MLVNTKVKWTTHKWNGFFFIFIDMVIKLQLIKRKQPLFLIVFKMFFFSFYCLQHIIIIFCYRLSTFLFHQFIKTSSVRALIIQETLYFVTKKKYFKEKRIKLIYSITWSVNNKRTEKTAQIFEWSWVLMKKIIIGSRNNFTKKNAEIRFYFNVL